MCIRDRAPRRGQVSCRPPGGGGRIIITIIIIIIIMCIYMYMRIYIYIYIYTYIYCKWPECGDTPYLIHTHSEDVHAMAYTS